MLERARHSVTGLSVGDAFGEQFLESGGDFHALMTRRALPAPPWHVTDDTVMALAIYEVLGAHGAVDQDALAHAFARRYQAEPHRGYGGGAHSILQRIGHGQSWQEVSPAVFGGTGSMGNGGAMRAAPVGAYFAGDMARVVAAARASAEVTHAHIEGQAGAIAVAVAAAWACGQRGVARPDPEPMFALVLEHTPASETRDRIDEARALPRDASVAQAVRALGSGQRVLSQDTVPFCLWCVARHVTDYAEALWTTVAGHGDCDTTCAIVGGIVVCATDVDAIPAAWLAAREPLPDIDNSTGHA
jgi:ADP-ribosylglycohydrolase